MTRIHPRAAAVILTAFASFAAVPAQAAAIGTFLGPHIVGTVRPGEFDEARADLEGRLDKPLSLDINVGSSSLEVMRIGLWLREQRPALKLRGSCVGACAWFMLDSGRSLEVAKGTVIAFSVFPEMWAQVRMQLDRGDLSIDDERSQATKNGFLGRIPGSVWRGAAELRDTRLTRARAPDWIQRFVEATTTVAITRMTVDEDDFNFAATSTSQRCLWWIPDAEGLRQLGLSVPRYVPPDREAAAKLLKTSPRQIYIGPALRELPESSLCEGEDTRLTMPST